MRGLMMDQPLLISSILEYAAEVHGAEQVVSAYPWDGISRHSWRTIAQRARKLARALSKLGVGEGDRVATLAWNGHRHLELYYAVSGMGAVIHTVNPRLFQDQITYILNHGGAEVLCFDPDLVELVAACHPELDLVRHAIVLDDSVPEEAPDGTLSYEHLLQEADDDFIWPSFDERSASSLCYTSGTTGNPKGVLYSHRSTVLHAFSSALAHTVSVTPDDVVMPAVPMFHVNAWGTPYYSPMCGASMVLPGPRLDGENLFRLISEHNVTMTAGVPTVWMGLLEYARTVGEKIPHLQRVVIGGSAAPPSVIDAFEREHAITVVHAWGMTEMSPLGSVGTLSRRRRQRIGPAHSRKLQESQGPRMFAVEMKVVDDQGVRQPHNDSSRGHLYVRGPWVTSAYYKNPQASAESFDEEGWFKTGDIAVIDDEGFVTLVDRSKDVIKSGGEWISSIDLEGAAMQCPGVSEAAAIAAEHPKWGERPVLVVVASDASLTAEGLLEHLAGLVARWWLPDKVFFVEAIPHTATGKVQKLALRQQFGACLLEQ